MNKAICVIAEHFNGGLRPVTAELAACALEIQRLDPAPIRIVIVGDDVEGPAREAAQTTGLDVIAASVKNLESHNADAYKNVLEKLTADMGCGYICAANTTQGLDFAPGLAVRLKGACITGVERVIDARDGIGFARSIHGGKVLAQVRPRAKPVVLTVQPGAFKPVSLDKSPPGSVDVRILDAGQQRSRSLGLTRVSEDSDLRQADVIVSAGRGLGGPENLDPVRRLAGLFSNSSVGGSRPVCDMGWLGHGHQVGLTGSMVAPGLYMACGISGAAQHIAGMGESGFIVAVNMDPDAAIFRVADVCIVEDASVFIPIFIEEVEKIQFSGNK